jgi:hypothetical protein
LKQAEGFDLSRMTKAQNSPGWDGRFKTTFKKLLEANLRK